MTEHRRKVGILTILVGVLVSLTGASVMVDWYATGDHWEVGIKGPVWLVLGVILALIGRELKDE